MRTWLTDAIAHRRREMYFATVVACGLITFHALPDGWPFLVRLATMVAAQYDVGMALKRESHHGL